MIENIFKEAILEKALLDYKEKGVVEYSYSKHCSGGIEITFTFKDGTQNTILVPEEQYLLAYSEALDESKRIREMQKTVADMIDRMHNEEATK